MNGAHWNQALELIKKANESVVDIVMEGADITIIKTDESSFLSITDGKKVVSQIALEPKSPRTDFSSFLISSTPHFFSNFHDKK